MIKTIAGDGRLIGRRESLAVSLCIASVHVAKKQRESMSLSWQSYIGTLESISQQLQLANSGRRDQSRLIAVSSIVPKPQFSIICRKKHPQLFADQQPFGPTIIADQWVANRSWNSLAGSVVLFQAWPSPLDVSGEHAIRLAHFFLTLDQIASDIAQDDKAGHGWADVLTSSKLDGSSIARITGKGLPWDRDGKFYLFADYLHSSSLAINALCHNADPVGFDLLRHLLSNNDIALARKLFCDESGMTDVEVQQFIGVATKNGGKMARRRIQEACEKTTPRMFEVIKCGKSGRAIKHKLAGRRNLKV